MIEKLNGSRGGIVIKPETAANVAFAFTLVCQGAIVLTLVFMILGFWTCTPALVLAIVLFTFLGAVGTLMCAVFEDSGGCVNGGKCYEE